MTNATTLSAQLCEGPGQTHAFELCTQRACSFIRGPGTTVGNLHPTCHLGEGETDTHTCIWKPAPSMPCRRGRNRNTCLSYPNLRNCYRALLYSAFHLAIQSSALLQSGCTLGIPHAKLPTAPRINVQPGLHEGNPKYSPHTPCMLHVCKPVCQIALHTHTTILSF